MGGAGAMAHMAEAAKKNREKVAEKKAQFKKRSKQRLSFKQPVSRPKVEQPPKEQMAKIIADIQKVAGQERKKETMRSFIVITLIIMLFSLVLLFFNKLL